MEETATFLSNIVNVAADITTTAGTEVTSTLLLNNITDVPHMTTTDGMPAMMKDSYTSTAIEPQLPTIFVVFFFTMRFLFSGFAIFGNALTITAVARFENLQNNTNLLICSLAIADMLAACLSPVSLAHHLLSDQPAFIPLCLTDRILNLIGVFANLFSILGIAIDRYLFINHPLHYPLWVTPTKTYTFIAISWAFVVSEITAIFSSSYYLVNGLACTFSVILSKQPYGQVLIPQVYILATFTLVFYVAISRTAHKQGRAIAALNQPFDTNEASLNRQHKKIAKMLIMVLGTYFVCYLPPVIAILIRGSSPSMSWLYVEKVAVLVYWMNTWLNPIIYAWKSEELKVAFRKLLGMKPSNVVNPS